MSVVVNPTADAAARNLFAMLHELDETADDRHEQHAAADAHAAHDGVRSFSRQGVFSPRETMYAPASPSGASIAP